MWGSGQIHRTLCTVHSILLKSKTVLKKESLLTYTVCIQEVWRERWLQGAPHTHTAASLQNPCPWNFPPILSTSVHCMAGSAPGATRVAKQTRLLTSPRDDGLLTTDISTREEGAGSKGTNNPRRPSGAPGARGPLLCSQRSHWFLGVTSLEQGCLSGGSPPTRSSLLSKRPGSGASQQPLSMLGLPLPG